MSKLNLYGNRGRVTAHCLWCQWQAKHSLRNIHCRHCETVIAVIKQQKTEEGSSGNSNSNSTATASLTLPQHPSDKQPEPPGTCSQSQTQRQSHHHDDPTCF